MPRVYLPLLPLPALALVVAVAACTRSSSEETTRIIPPPAPYVAPVTEAPRTAPPAAALAQGAKASAVEERPSDEDVKEFERGVGK
jgi:hypothetical protein